MTDIATKIKPLVVDDKDREILYALSLNGRISLTDLAVKVNASKQVISYRLKQLEARKIIKKYYAIPNVYSLGKTHYRVFLRYHNMNPAVERELSEYLVTHPRVAWVLRGDGDFDLIFIVWADDIIHFETVHDDIMERFSSYFGEKYFSIATRIEYLPYHFLKEGKEEWQAPNEPSMGSIVLGDAMGRHKLDDLEKKILVSLNQDGRVYFARLAEKFGVSVPVVKKKIENMEARRIIMGYNVKIDHNLLGYTYRKVLLKLNKSSGKELEALCMYLKKRNSVIYLLKTIGTYDFEFELMTETSEAFYGLLRELRRDFADNIKAYSVVTMNMEPKYEHLAL